MTKRLVLLAIFLCVIAALVFSSKVNTERLRASGLVEADEIRLGSRVGGRVASVYVEEGQAVKQGELLVELEPFDLLEREQELQLSLAVLEAELQRVSSGFRQEEKAQAKAKLDQLQARLDLLHAGPRPQEIEAARARLALAQADHKRAEQDYQRISRLAQANATSQAELDSARQALDATSAGVLVRKEELALLELGTREEEMREAAARVEEAKQAWQLMEHGYRQEDIQRAQAARDAAQAKLDAIRKQKAELNIISPIDGTIEALTLQPGDMVAAGAPVLSMLDPSKLWVRAYVPQDLPGLQLGRRVQITLDSEPKETREGVISFISRQAEFTPSNVQTPDERSKLVFRIKVTIEDDQQQLRPGMMADVWLNQLSEEP